MAFHQPHRPEVPPTAWPLNLSHQPPESNPAPPQVISLVPGSFVLGSILLVFLWVQACTLTLFYTLLCVYSEFEGNTLPNITEQTTSLSG